MLDLEDGFLFDEEKFKSGFKVNVCIDLLINIYINILKVEKKISPPSEFEYVDSLSLSRASPFF